jgi:hypothetical protein
MFTPLAAIAAIADIAVSSRRPKTCPQWTSPRDGPDCIVRDVTAEMAAADLSMGDRHT